MANNPYTSGYSGSEIDAIIALFNEKGLGNVTGFIKRNADGTFEEGNPATGSVTSVGLENDTNGGLTVTGSPITSSGTLKIKHTNVLSSAQATQALYPIKIDKNGHISAYGTAVTSLPASDVYDWAKAANKPSYTYSEVGAAASGHTHDLSIASSSGTSALDMAANTKYVLTAGGKTFIFKTPADSAPVSSVNSKTGAVTLTASDVGQLRLKLWVRGSCRYSPNWYRRRRSGASSSHEPSPSCSTAPGSRGGAWDWSSR